MSDESIAHLPPLSPESARALIDRGALLVDVRSDAGRASAGTVPGALVVAKSDVIAFAEEHDPGRDIVVFCGSIEGSGPFVDYLAAQGFTGVAHVDGGFDALAGQGVPIDRPSQQ